MSSREEFERLPEIAKVLRVFDVIFDGENYSAKGNHSEVKKVYALGFLNGAWYAFQEQQKVINGMLECMDDAIRLIDEGNSWDAKELLK